MKKNFEVDFSQAIEEKMNYYPGSEEFQEIINEYRIENKQKNALMKDVYENVYSKDINLILKERNKKVKKTEMEEDEAEKLTNFKLASKTPQKLTTLISNLAEKKKNEQKKDEEYFKGKRQENPDNKFGTQIRRNNSPPLKKTLLETIYEKNTTKIKENDNKNNLKNNKYRRNFKEKRNSSNNLNSPRSKNNSSEEKSDTRDEITSFKKRSRVISGKNTINETLKTSADSRIYSGKSSMGLDNSNYISILQNPGINICKLVLLIFLSLANSLIEKNNKDIEDSRSGSRILSSAGMDIINGSSLASSIDISPTYMETQDKLMKFLETPNAKKIIKKLVFKFLKILQDRESTIQKLLYKIEVYEENLVLNKNRGTKIFEDYRNSAYDIKKRYNYMFKCKFY